MPLARGERVSLSKLAIGHLERTARPIRVAVDISIWLFQVQAGRGGKNPELRTLFFRLLKLLALPIHPLFVYDGRHKPPFKRGKAVSARSYGNSPLIQRSKDLIERFRFPWHEAPGEAEAECARLQEAGVVDAVMSNDVDALMFGSTLTIMNFSKESGSGTSAATHVTCYSMGKEGHISNIPLNRAGMILFAMLSGGDYLPSGVPKCGSKLAAEIAKAGFGEDLLQELASHSSDLDSGLSEWRERLQYELEENESGYFATKHKAVRIPENFPDRTILEYYAEPKVSTKDEITTLRRHLRNAWDREIEPLAIRRFAADNFEWNYRSGARKVIKLLAEPLISYRLRLQRPVVEPSRATLAPDCDTPWLQKVYRSRANFGTDGMTELQVDMLPIDVVGLDLLAEEPNPVPPTEEGAPVQNAGDEEDDLEASAEAAPPTPSKTRVTKRFDPFSIEKVWIFEAVARLGIPDTVKRWDDEQAAKARKATAPKKPTSKRSGPRKKGPIDPGMPRGSIEKYGFVKKGASGLASSKTNLLETATSTPHKAPSSESTPIDLDDPFAPSMYTHQQSSGHTPIVSSEVDDLIDTFASLSTISPAPRTKRHPMATPARIPARAGILASEEVGLEELSYSVDSEYSAASANLVDQSVPIPSSVSKTRHYRNSKKAEKSQRVAQKNCELEELELNIGSLCLDNQQDDAHFEGRPAQSLSQPEPVAGPKPSSAQVDASPKPLSLNSRPVHLAEEWVSSGQRPDEDHSAFRHESNSPTVSKDKKKPAKKNKGTEARRAIGHAENVTTADGFWGVEAPTQSGSGQPETEVREPRRQNRAQAKRVPRVSILDMI
ncbi:hypothetical protein N7492_008713 [Penicillium capsulatum]|uniref:XPG-I domain-containing protein n=1 Tax=Penicillium capsulatum TaxID=69766 RepID=A0A9W9HTK6_9EURO|nr:hypothetical protein N7492_008713 [Penicillium capsulatum]